MITLTVPYPISSNLYWRTYMPRGMKFPITCVSAEAKAYKLAVDKIARLAGIFQPLKGRVALRYLLYPARPKDYEKRMRIRPEFWDDDVRCIDLDNAAKVLIDSLKGIVFEDDKWIRKIVAQRCAPDELGARVVVTVEKI